jgi:hypothetical protein
VASHLFACYSFSYFDANLLALTLCGFISVKRKLLRLSARFPSWRLRGRLPLRRSEAAENIPVCVPDELQSVCAAVEVIRADIVAIASPQKRLSRQAELFKQRRRFSQREVDAMRRKWDFSGAGSEIDSHCRHNYQHVTGEPIRWASSDQTSSISDCPSK